MRTPLSALNFNYNPEGIGSVILLLSARSFSLAIGCSIHRANGVSAGQGSDQYTQSGLNCSLLPSVYLK